MSKIQGIEMPQVTPLGLLRPFFTDKCGKLLVGGKVFTYEANSLTPKITYADSDGLMPNTHPVILDKSGEADIYLDGNYRFQIFNRFGVLIHDINNIRDHFKDQIQNFFTGNILAAGGLPENSSADYNYLMQRLAQIAVDKGWDASFVTTASSQNQQQINDFGGAKWYAKVGGYDLGATVKLDNGDTVKSTAYINTINPNIDMTGWFNETKFIEAKDKTFLDFGAKGDGESDDSISIGLASTWSSIYKRKVSGLDKTYKCSNVFFDSYCYLADAKLINNKDQDLISVLTTTISSDWLENVVFENIHINGVRQDARTIKATGTSEDGGRHGFRFRRPCRNIWIIRSSANYCASDGLCIFPDGRGGYFESVQNFNIIDSEFLWNRRHGGSNDRANGINFTNVKCKHNGLPLEGGSSLPATDGRQGDNFNGNYYGNGWDSEEYSNTTISQNMTFLNCDMTGNARGGLIILATSNVQTPTTPTNIKIIGGKYDKGVYNTDDNAAITITPNGISNVNPIYENTVIDAVSTTDSIFLRNNVNFSVTNTPCFLAVVDRSNGFADKKIRGVDIAPTASLKTPDGTPFGMFTYDATTGTKTVVDYQITHGMFNDGQSKYQDFRVGAFKFGQIETKVDSATNSTTWTWKTGADVERFRVGRYGAQLHISDSVPDSEIKNQGLVFELVSNTQLKIKVKGVDGVVRSSTLTLA